jgi:hypothetical protein
MLPGRSFLTAIDINLAKDRKENDRPAGNFPLGK